MRKKLASLAAALTSALAGASAALAAPISEKTAEEVGQKVVELVQGITLPLGSAIVFVAIVVAAFKIIATANKPEERAKAISSLPWILGGGLLLGGAMLAAGFIVGLMMKVGQ